MFGRALLIVALLGGSLPAATHAATFLRVISEPGDDTLHGRQRLEYDPSSGYTLTATTNPAGGVDFLRYRPCSGACLGVIDDDWFRFAPAAGQTFDVGRYTNARFYSNVAGPQPGLYADHDTTVANHCSTITGQFTVLELEKAADGKVLRFAADFEQHCDGQAPGFYGGVRFNSDVPYQQPIPFARASVRYVSEPGDPMAGMSSGVLEVVDGRTTVRGLTNHSVDLTLWNANWGTAWTSQFGAADFRPGTYTAVRPVQYSAPATMQIWNDGRLCREFAVASYTVLEVAWSPTGVPIRFAVDFDLRCDGASGTFHAGVRYNSSLPYVSPQAPPKSPPPITTASGTTANGRNVSISLNNSGTCSLADAMFLPPTATELFNLPPATLAFPDVYVSFRVTGCTAGQSVTATAEFTEELPTTAQWWQLSPTVGDATTHWYPVTATVEGKRISFSIPNGGADARIFGMVGVPGGVVQDLWWSGPAENGWGMSIIQHADKLFANIYVYDAQGKPVWYVMPAGTWNPAHTAFTGSLYLPKGSPFYAYDTSRFDIGAAVGTMTLTFANANEATSDYTINSVTGRKNLQRVLFGSRDPPTDQPHADLWWAGSAQNGWGLAVLQQYSTLFALWFTYDAAGNAAWYVMPGGMWAMRDDYRGPILRASGSPWLGVLYDASRHRLDNVGSFALRFNGTNAATFDYTVEGRTGSIPLSRIPF